MILDIQQHFDPSKCLYSLAKQLIYTVHILYCIYGNETGSYKVNMLHSLHKVHVVRLTQWGVVE